MPHFSRRTLLIALIVLSIAPIMMAYGSEIIFGLRPCSLCLYQRYVFGIVALVASLGLLARSARPWFLCALAVLFSNGLLASYHVLVELHWVMPPAQCGGSVQAAGSIANLRAQLMEIGSVSCDQVAWRLFGLSMATYNALYCFILSGTLIFMGERHDKSR